MASATFPGLIDFATPAPRVIVGFYSRHPGTNRDPDPQDAALGYSPMPGMWYSLFGCPIRH
jgi:hypothetical protein